jgi:hypothetical protein
LAAFFRRCCRTTLPNLLRLHHGTEVAQRTYQPSLLLRLLVAQTNAHRMHPAIAPTRTYRTLHIQASFRSTTHTKRFRWWNTCPNNDAAVAGAHSRLHRCQLLLPLLLFRLSTAVPSPLLPILTMASFAAPPFRRLQQSSLLPRLATACFVLRSRIADIPACSSSEPPRRSDQRTSDAPSHCTHLYLPHTPHIAGHLRPLHICKNCYY